MSNALHLKSARRITPAIFLGLFALALQPAVVMADTADEVKAEIISSNAYTRKNLKDMPDTIASKGAIEFWSSGGLVQNVGADAPASSYESFALTPKHIQVITLEEGKSAVAMYYSEGSFHENGGSAVAHYMTRVTEVYVKEGGKWKIRAAHYSPIAAGSGTSQTSID